MFWVFVHLCYEVPSNRLCCICLNLGRQYIHYTLQNYFWLLLSSVTSSLNNSNPVPLEALHAHAIKIHHVSQMMLYALDNELFQAFSIHLSSCHSGTGNCHMRSLLRSFFSEYTRLLIWPPLMFLLSLGWICFVFEA